MAIMKCSNILLLLFSVLVLQTLAADKIPRASCGCTCTGTGTPEAGYYTEGSTYQANLNTIFSQLTSPKDFNYGFYNLSAGESPNKVYAIALCRGDTTQDECSNCLKNTITDIKQHCSLNYKEMIKWSDDDSTLCMLRYANREIFGEMEKSPVRCVPNPANVSDPTQFSSELDKLLTKLSSRAAEGGSLRKYAADNSSLAGLFKTVYAMVQCTPDLSQEDCSNCLASAREGISDCCFGRKGCKNLRPGCFLRFEDRQFYKNPVPLPSRGKGNKRTFTIIIVIASVFGVLIMITIAFCILRTRKTSQNVEKVHDVHSNHTKIEEH